MGRTSYRPTYDLDEAKALAARGSMMLSRRPTSFLAERYASVSEAATEVFAAIEPRHFHKSVELENNPGTWADVYQGVVYDGIGWYVKFFMDAGKLVVVWSMNWDGATH